MGLLPKGVALRSQMINGYKKRNAVMAFLINRIDIVNAFQKYYLAKVNFTVLVSVPRINVTSESSPGLNLLKASV